MLILLVSVQSSPILKKSHEYAGGFEVLLLFTMDSSMQSLRSWK